MFSRINLIIYSTIITIVALFFISTSIETIHENKVLENQLITLEKAITNEYKKRLKESTAATIQFIDITYKKLLEKQESILQKKSTKLNKKYYNEFLEIVRIYLYKNIIGKTRYTWINKIINFKGGDNYAIRLIHPNLKKTEGKYLSTKINDIKGNKPYLEELKGIKKNNEIYFKYFFKKINSDKISEKLTYAILYKRLNWVIATGIPLDELNKNVSKQKRALENDFTEHSNKNYFLKLFGLLLIITILLILRDKLNKTLLKNESLNKQLKEKLKNVESDLNKIFQLPINIFLVMNFKKDILQINSSWKKILGYEENELKNKNLLEILNKKDIQKFNDLINKLKNEEITTYFECELLHKNGHYRLFSWSFSSEVKNQLIYGAAQDTTELKEKSDLMYQQSKMAAIGEMTANIAHQWRQPLSMISTASSGILLKKEVGELDDKFLVNTLEKITSTTQYLSDTIEDFRNFYSPNKQKQSIKLEKIINKMLNLVETRFKNNNIKMKIKIEEIELFTYENELLQVLINLINNAKDQLLINNIENKLIFINAYKKEASIYIEVLDNAKGVDEKIIDRIFEPYFTTKDKSVGTGIGLYMSEEIVKKHLKGQLHIKNETFTFENKEYKGAKFTILL